MRKIRCELDQLTVQSFSTEEAPRTARGTVRALMATETCRTFLHEGCGQTQFDSCAWTRLGAPCICS